MKSGMTLAGGASLCRLGTWVVEHLETCQVLQTVWMDYPNQAGGPQGFRAVERDSPVANVLGIGSGWKQSKQN